MERAPTLLLVDDTRANIRVLKAMLAPQGYELESAASGEEALPTGAQRHDLHVGLPASHARSA
jgi:CheY-like chemotaxis protein